MEKALGNVKLEAIWDFELFPSNRLPCVYYLSCGDIKKAQALIYPITSNKNPSHHVYKSLEVINSLRPLKLYFVWQMLMCVNKGKTVTHQAIGLLERIRPKGGWSKENNMITTLKYLASSTTRPYIKIDIYRFYKVRNWLMLEILNLKTKNTPLIQVC